LLGAGNNSDPQAHLTHASNGANNNSDAYSSANHYTPGREVVARTYLEAAMAVVGVMANMIFFLSAKVVIYK